MTERSNNTLLAWLHRFRWYLAVAAAIVLIGGGGAMAVYAPVPSSDTHSDSQAYTVVTPSESQPATTDDRYPNWPPAGTRQPTEGEAPFYANAVVALTCQDHIPSLQPKALVKDGVVPTKKITFDWVTNDPALCAVQWKIPDVSEAKTVVLTYDGQPYKGHHTWTQHETGYSADGTTSMEVRSGSQDIALLLIDFIAEKQGQLILYGPNGTLSPPRSIMS